MGRKKWKETLLKASELLYPRVCPLCEEILAPFSAAYAGNGNPYICRSCYERLVFRKEPGCLKCSRPVEDETEEYCPDCKNKVRYFDQGKALLIHEDSAKKILYDLKYHNRRDHARMLAYEAAERFADTIRVWKPDVLIPVPLHRKRERKRGFNQAGILAMELGRELFNRDLALQVDPGFLVRVRSTSAQKELGAKSRKENIRGAFEICYRESQGKYRGKKILLVDDIYTSGATLSECARVLKKAGTRAVFFLTFSIG